MGEHVCDKSRIRRRQFHTFWQKIFLSKIEPLLFGNDKRTICEQPSNRIFLIFRLKNNWRAGFKQALVAEFGLDLSVFGQK